MKKIILLILCLVLLSGCGGPISWLGSLFKGDPGSESESDYDKEETYEKKPVLVAVNSRGDKKVAYHITRTKIVSKERKTVVPERTTWQKLWDAIVGLGIATIVILIGLFFLTNGSIVWVILRKFRKIRETLSHRESVLGAVVKGVKESKMVEDGNGLHNALRSNVSNVVGAKELIMSIIGKLP